MYPKGLHFVWMDHGVGSCLESRTFEDNRPENNLAKFG
jgi:hypothetical protein